MGFLEGTKLDVFAEESGSMGGLMGVNSARAQLGLQTHCWSRRFLKRDPRAGAPQKDAEGEAGLAAQGQLILLQPVLMGSGLIPVMKNPFQIPCVIYSYCGVPSESASTALQYFPFAEEFPPLSLQVIIPNHSEQH